MRVMDLGGKETRHEISRDSFLNSILHTKSPGFDERERVEPKTLLHPISEGRSTVEQCAVNTNNMFVRLLEPEYFGTNVYRV